MTLPYFAEVLGEGEPVLLLHGWGASAASLGAIPAALAEAGFQAHALDLPGFGAAPPPPTPWCVADYGEWVRAYLDEQQLNPVRLVGHSFGGRLSLYLAATYPQRVRQLVLTSAAGVRPSLPPRLRFYYAVRRALLRLLSLPGLRRLEPSVRAWLFARMASADARAAAAQDPVMYETLKRVVNEDLLPLAPRIQAPTLLIWGDQDDATPLAQGQALEAAIPDAGLVVLAGAGHYAYAERQAEFIRIVQHFFLTP
ncbi:MAG: alpha/beta hydrolase [Anaerolineae bacterium]|nr:alpha/beta hydrolase [Anaerolineae bacterium]